MRWCWIDALREAVPGERACAVKLVTRAECDELSAHPELPYLPASLVIEGAAQLAGLLVGQAIDYARNVILAKVARARFHRLALAGDTLDILVTIAARSEEAARCQALVTVRGELLAEIDLLLDLASELRGARGERVGLVVFGPHDDAIRAHFAVLCARPREGA